MRRLRLQRALEILCVNVEAVNGLSTVMDRKPIRQALSRHIKFYKNIGNYIVDLANEMA